MDQIVSLSKEEQTQIYQEAAARSKDIKAPSMIEKDFWVCWTLKQIFSIPELGQHITFKGGTSLSKCYKIINRFSEDCDLTLNKEFIGITEDAEGIYKKSRKQREKSIKALIDAAKNKVAKYIKPVLTTKFQTELAAYFNEDEWRIKTNPCDAQNLFFYYPSTLNIKTNEYVQSIVKLEFGARGDNSPTESKIISPYVYSLLTEIFTKVPSIPVHTLTAQRTFWEKVTLLHAEHHRNLDKPYLSRMFRHYYDVVMLDRHGITSQALDDLQLLNIVLMNKQTYFSSPSANYETAKIGTMRLLPKDAFINVLRQDCEKMSEMFFGETPNFDDIMAHIEKLERVINFK